MSNNLPHKILFSQNSEGTAYDVLVYRTSTDGEAPASLITTQVEIQRGISIPGFNFTGESKTLQKPHSPPDNLTLDPPPIANSSNPGKIEEQGTGADKGREQSRQAGGFYQVMREPYSSIESDALIGASEARTDAKFEKLLHEITKSNAEARQASAEALSSMRQDASAMRLEMSEFRSDVKNLIHQESSSLKDSINNLDKRVIRIEANLSFWKWAIPILIAILVGLTPFIISKLESNKNPSESSQSTAPAPPASSSPAIPNR